MDGGKRIERWGAFVFSGPFGLRESISTVHGVPENTDVVFWGHGVDGNGDAVCTCFGERRLAGLHRAYLSPEMELGHILCPSDPVTRESSDPETQFTR